MQLDFHYYATYCAASCSGIIPERRTILRKGNIQTV